MRVKGKGIAMNDDEKGKDVFHYGDPNIASADAPIPKWLKWNYAFWIVFGIIWWHLFWNGNTGNWFDRGYWQQLQRAANTTFPIENFNDIREKPQD